MTSQDLRKQLVEMEVYSDIDDSNDGNNNVDRFVHKLNEKLIL